MASVSSATTSLGNTSLRGYGGLSSGIDRDAIIEQMTAATNAKITSQKREQTKLQWKQEAMQNISDKIIDLEDNYFSYTAGSNLKSASFFSKNQVTVHGDSDVTKFVSASGNSALIEQLSIRAVKQMASAATTQSAEKGGSTAIKTGIGDLQATVTLSNLKGTKLSFGSPGTEGRYNVAATFTFPSSYTYKDETTGKTETVEIDYTTNDIDQLVGQLNEAVKNSSFKLGEKGKFEFKKNDDGTLGIELKDVKDGSNYTIDYTSSALKALGFDSSKIPVEDQKKGITLDQFKENAKPFEETYIEKQTMAKYLLGKSLSVSYGGQTKNIAILTEDDLKGLAGDTEEEKLAGLTTEKLAELMQGRIDKTFGKDKIKVGHADGLSFDVVTKAGDQQVQTLTINSSDAEIRKNIGIEKNASNKLSADASLWANRDKLFAANTYTDDEAGRKKFEEDLANFTINGTKIEGLTKDTTINQLIEKINETEDVGIKASYLSGSNTFLLVASQTGTGREIDFGSSDLAKAIFGDGTSADGKDAIIEVSYGNGVNTTIQSSSNTFNLEGMKVTVSGTFGYVKDADGNPIYDRIDTSQAVTFSSKADVDGVTEKVKEFFKAYNEMVTEINAQITTRPDSDYGPLTDAQKEEMDETSIKNWEEKAKMGILFNNATMRDLSVDIQGILTKLMQNGVNYKDLEDMGITVSDNYKDGGTITFDEAKFKEAMTNEPEKVSQVFAGGGSVQKGLAEIIEDTLTPYATRFATDNKSSASSKGSYGRLIEEAGSKKVPLSLTSNEIYKQLKEMEETISKLKSQLKVEQDRYISQFTTMETMINKMNAQSSYLSQLQG